jgi:hypothetical protein
MLIKASTPPTATSSRRAGTASKYVQNLKVMMVGPEIFVSRAAREGWRMAGVDLLGPFLLSNMDVRQARQASGVVIDISQETHAIFELSELLEAQKISFLYALNEQAVGREGAFIVSGAAADIQAILTALLKDGDESARH